MKKLFSYVSIPLTLAGLSILSAFATIAAGPLQPLATVIVPTPESGIIDGAGIISASWTTIGSFFGLLAIFVALGLGIALFPRLANMAKNMAKK